MQDLYYYCVQDSNMNYYSCDMVRIHFEIYNDKDCINDFQNYINDYTRIGLTVYPINTHDFKYKNMITIEYVNGAKLKLGFCFNGYDSDDKYRGFVEFNPNKCYQNALCREDIKRLRDFCLYWDIVRWDLAVDIPISRENVSMAKDERRYEVIMNSKSDKTESLGQRNKEGRVKLYNKTKESNLDYDLTRLEITLGNIEDIDEKYYRTKEPEVFVFDSQKELDFSSLSQTQKVLVECITDSDNPLYYFSKLDKNMKTKLRPYVLRGDYQIKTDFKCVVKIMNFIEREIQIYKCVI